jgi:hypothetical protein
MKTPAFFFLMIGLFLPLSLGAQEGFAATGTAESEQRETALSQAKSNALEEAFKALSKDRLFVNLYFQNSTVYSRTEFGEPKEERTFTGGYKITIQVFLDPFALNIIQNEYIENASAILNQAEEDLATLGPILQGVEALLNQGDYPGAYREYQTVLERAQAIENLLKDIADLSVRSDQDNTKEAILSQTFSRSERAAEGLRRLEEIERQAAADLEAAAIVDSFGVLANDQSVIGSRIQSYLARAPFYGVPGAELGKIKLEVENDRKSLGGIHQEMRKIRDLARDFSVLFQTRLSQAIRQNEELRNTADKILSDVNTEINDPRIQRMERERQAQRESAAFWKGVREGLAWLLIRETNENINLRMNLPVFIKDSSAGFNILDDANLRIEFYYDYIWLQFITEYQSWNLSNGESQEEMGGSLGFGVGKNLFFGGGVNWDYFKNSSDGSEIPRSLGLSFYVGDKDRNHNWPFWLLGLHWEVPNDWWPVNLGYIVNLGGDFTIRPGRLFKVGAGFLLRGFLRGEFADNAASALDYRFNWYLEGSVKPGPFLIGLRFERDSFNAWDTDSSIANNYWKLFGGYSF